VSVSPFDFPETFEGKQLAELSMVLNK